VLPGNLALDTGFAHIWLGELPTRAPNGVPGAADPSYVYTAIVAEM
jgi:hypothetical protein